MFKGWQTVPHSFKALAIEISTDPTFTRGQHAKHFAPWVDDHTVPPGPSPCFMATTLGAGDNVTLILDCPCPQKYFPVRFTRCCCKGCRQHKHIDGTERPEIFGKAQVIADR